MDGNEYNTKRGFLPNALSVFDILEANGYELVLIRPADADFSGMKSLFTQHGNWEIKDKIYWDNLGMDHPRNLGTGWGYNDKFILEKAREEFHRLTKENKPFILLIETIDTHAPDGFCPENERTYNDLRDVIVRSERLISEFVDDILSHQHERTAIAVLGDHYFMGEPQFLKNSSERQLFNMFLGDVPPIPESKKDSIVTAFDVAPTILHLAGAKWENDQFGLGVSFFSNEPSLAQQMGIDAFNQNLEKKSRFYERFY